MASGIFGILLGVHPSMLKTKSRSPRGTSSAPAPAVAANKDASSSRQHLLAERESLYRYPASKTLHVTATRVGGEKLCRVEIKDDSDSEVLRQEFASTIESDEPLAQYQVLAWRSLDLTSTYYVTTPKGQVVMKLEIEKGACTNIARFSNDQQGRIITSEEIKKAIETTGAGNIIPLMLTMRKTLKEWELKNIWSRSFVVEAQANVDFGIVAALCLCFDNLLIQGQLEENTED